MIKDTVCEGVQIEFIT